MNETPTLAQLMQVASQAESVLFEHGGDVDAPEVQAALAVTETLLPEKIDAYKVMSDRFKMLQAHFKAQKELMAKFEKAFESCDERLMANLQFQMELHEVNQLHGYLTTYSVQRNPPSVDVIDESKIDKSYFIEKTTRALDKKRILQELKMGVPVEGAEIKVTTRLVAKPTTHLLSKAASDG